MKGIVKDPTRLGGGCSYPNGVSMSRRDGVWAYAYHDQSGTLQTEMGGVPTTQKSVAKQNRLQGDQRISEIRTANGEADTTDSETPSKKQFVSIGITVGVLSLFSQIVGLIPFVPATLVFVVIIVGLIGAFIKHSFYGNQKRSYHAAEHQAIHTLMDQRPLTLLEVAKTSRISTSCGGSFLMLVIILSAAVNYGFDQLSPWAALSLPLVMLAVPFASLMVFQLQRKYKLLWPLSRLLTVIQLATTAPAESKHLEAAVQALKISGATMPVKKTGAF